MVGVRTMTDSTPCSDSSQRAPSSPLAARLRAARANARAGRGALGRRYATLIVSCSDAQTRALTSLIPEVQYYPVVVATSVADAKRKMLDREFDLVIVNTPLSDEFGFEFAYDLCEEGGACPLLLTSAERYAETSVRASARGALTMARPISEPDLLHILNLMVGVRERLRRMEKKTATLEEKMREIRILNRAKLALVSDLKMTEEDAHRYLEKQAMDRCVSKLEIAESVIATRQG